VEKTQCASAVEIAHETSLWKKRDVHLLWKSRIETSLWKKRNVLLLWKSRTRLHCGKNATCICCGNCVYDFTVKKTRRASAVEIAALFAVEIALRLFLWNKRREFLVLNHLIIEW
jgi:hypothetical protein